MKRARTATIAAASVIVGLVAASPAWAQDTLDQQQVAIGFHSAWLGDTQTVAQPFTAGMSGLLTSVSVDVNRFNNSQTDLRVGVYATASGVPMGDALASTSLSAAEVAQLPADRAAGSLQVEFATPVDVTEGTTYAIVVASSNGYPAFHWLTSAEGTKSRYGNVNQAGTYSQADSWSTYEPLAFATYMRAAGAGSSAGSGSDDGSSERSQPKVAITLQPQGGPESAVAVSVEPGSWIQVPSSAPAPRDGSASTLLGWSTSPAFPVDRARAQVAAGYGAIDEVIDGQRLIFIPAGGFTQVSGSNTLYAVWG